MSEHVESQNSPRADAPDVDADAAAALEGYTAFGGQRQETGTSDEVPILDRVSSRGVAFVQDPVQPENQSDLFRTPRDNEADVEDGSDEEAKRKTLRAIYDDITSSEFSARQRFFHIVHGTPVLTPDDMIAAAFNTFIVVMVVGSTITFIVETMPEYYSTTGPQGTFFVLETIWVAVFTFDLLLRFVSATALRHVFNIQTLFDFLSVIGYYIAFAVDTSDSTISFQILRMLRLSRVFRMSKLSRKGIGFSMMTKTIRRSKQGMLLLVLLVAISMVLGAAVIYSVEAQTGVWDAEQKKWYYPNGEESPFQSIPNSFFFVLLTLTTVGYGNEVPSQGYGRTVAVVIMIFGVLLLSFPNILIGSNFQTVHESWQRQRARNALGRRFRFVRYAVRFVRMWRDFRKHGQMKLLRVSSAYNIAQSFAPMRGSMQFEDTVAFEPPEDRNRNKNLTRRTINFFFRSVDFAEFDYTTTFNALSQGSFDAFDVRGLETVTLLQRLVQVFSCCCTIEEMYESLLLLPESDCSVKQCDLTEMACHLANANIIELFVLNRFDDHMILFMSKKGIRFLQHFGESPNLPCVRSHAESVDIWKETTGQDPPNVFPMDGFRRWQEMQESVPKRTRINFHFDLKDPASKTNSVFRHSISSSSAASMHRKSTMRRKPSVARRGSNKDDSGSPLSPLERVESTGFNWHQPHSAAAAPAQCAACLHCVMQANAATEEDLNRYEEFLLLQRRLVTQQLEVVSMRREAARSLTDPGFGRTVEELEPSPSTREATIPPGAVFDGADRKSDDAEELHNAEMRSSYEPTGPHASSGDQGS